MKLKTLKDLHLERIDTRINDVIKEEAIKWFKETKKYKGQFSFGTAEDFIKHFFNLTEEDLQ
jgi:hypothetical protein